MAEKDFVVKNGLVVNTDLIVADGDLNRVGINNATPDATLTVTGTANVSGNVALAAFLSTKDSVVSNSIVVGANITVNTSTLFVGNSTVNSTQNSTLVQVSNSTTTANLTSSELKIGTAVVNTTQFSVGSNSRLTTTGLFVGNSTVNVVANSISIVFSNSVGSFTVNSQSFSGTANNATNFAGQPQSYYANATNITTGTLDAARLPSGNSTVKGALIVLDSISNTSITDYAASANSVKNAYDRAIDANTRASSAQTAAAAAYTNATTYASNATNLTSGTLASARISGAYTGITSVGTLGTLTVTGNVALNNFSVTSNATSNLVTINGSNVNIDSGVLFVDSINNRIGINNTSPDAQLSVTGSANVSGDLTVLGNLVISGNTVSQGTQEFTGALTPSSNGILLGNTSKRWNLSATVGDFSGNVIAGGILTVGNSTLNVTISSTLIDFGSGSLSPSYFSGAANSANNASFLSGQPPSYYTNATNITTGTLASARLPTGNATNIGGLQIIDSVTNTSTTITTSANSVKNAYDRAIDANTRASSAQTAAASAYTNATTFASNATNITTGTLASARLPTGNATNIGGLQIVDSISNTSITVTATANNVKTAYDAAIAANTRAASAQTAASDAYSNAIAANTRASSAQTAAIAAYTNAIAIAANADNITSGTVAAARLPFGNATVRGALIVLDSVTNTSIIDYAASANSVKNAYDRAIDANTRAFSAQTAAAAAYTNAVSYAGTIAGTAYTNAITFAANASNLGNGTVPSARIAGNYTGINAVGTLVGLAVTGNSNFDSGVLFVDGTNNRVGVNTTSPSISFQIAANDAMFVPFGTTDQRPTGANGMFRYNIDTGSFEGYANGSWGNIAGGESGGGYYKGNNGAIGSTTNKENLYRINSNTQSNNITIAAGENALSAGPMTIATGYNLTVETGGRVVIV